KRAFFAAGRAAARSVGAKVHFRAVDRPYAEMRTNGPLAEIFKQELRALGRRTVDTPRKGMGSLDMGNVSQVVPSIHPFVAIAPKSAPLHSRAFAARAGSAPGRLGLAVASRALAATLVRAVHDPELRRAARRAFARGGYGTPVLLDRVDTRALRRDPKPLLGYSDETALQEVWRRAGAPILYGPHVVELADRRAYHARSLGDALQGRAVTVPFGRRG